MSTTKESIQAYVKKQPLVVGAAGLAILLLAVLVYRYPAAGELETELAAKSAEAARLKANLDYSSGLQDQVATLEKINADVSSRLIRPNDIPSNVRYFIQLESETGVKLPTPSAPPPASYAGTKGTYIVVPYTLDLTGTFRQILTFIRKLESGDRFCRFKSAEVRRDVTSEMGADGSQPVDALRARLVVEYLGQPPS